MLIFIYGTLKKAQPNHYILQGTGPTFIGNVITVKPVTFDLDGGMYPKLWEPPGVPSVWEMDGIGKLEGELWDVPDNRIGVLDRFEGAPDLYYRGTLEVRLAGETLECQTYFYKGE